MATVIVKNTTGSSVFIDEFGIEVDANGELNLSELFSFEDISSCEDIKTYVSDGTFIINDGTIDLSVSDGLKHVYHQTVYEDSFEDGGGGSLITEQLHGVQIRRTTNLALSTGWQDVTFDTTDFENNINVVEHSDVDTDRILIKDDGVYLISYSFTVRSSGATRDCLSRIRKNDTDTLNGSEILQNIYKDETHQQTENFVTTLNNGDWLSLQVMAASTPINTFADYIFYVIKLEGIRGPKGDDGEQGQDGQDGQDGTGLGIDVACLQVRQSNNFSPGSSWTNIEFDETDIESHPTILQHDNTNTERIVFKESGYYLISINIITKSGEVRSKFLLNGSTEIVGSVAHQDPSSSDEDGIYTSFIIQILNDNDYITAQLKGDSADIHYCHVTALKLQGAKGDQGIQGDIGPRGESFSIDEYNDLDEAKITDIQDNSGASTDDVYFMVVVDDNRSNQNSPVEITGDMTGHILMYDGTSWNDFGQFTGVKGNDGINGHGWFSGSANPTNGQYENDDHYLNTTSGEIFNKISGSWVSIGNLSGPTGPTGANGTDGNSVKIQLDDSDIMSNVAIINFEGEVDITTDPSSKVNVSVNQSQICQIYNNSGGINVNNTTPVSISFDKQMYKDDIYTHSTSTNNSRLYITQNGIYKISYCLNWDGSTSRRTVHSFMRKNGTTKILLSDSYDYSRNNTDDKGSNTAMFFSTLNNGDYIELMGEKNGTSGNAIIISDQCWLTIELIRKV